MNFNQTLQSKYPHLEISVLSLDSVKKDNESFRIDSEYFKREYLENEEIICKFEYKTLEEISTRITNGHTPYGENLLENDVKFITAEFIDDFVITEVKKFISFESHSNYLKRSILHNGDIIFSIKGKIGNAVPIFDVSEPLNINQDVARLSIKKDINIFYVCAFLNSKYGKKQTEAKSTGQINPFIALGTLKNLKIPIFSKEFQLEIEKLVKDSHKALESSKALYKEAEEILYKELDLSLQDNSFSSLRGSETTEASVALATDPHLQIHTQESQNAKNGLPRIDFVNSRNDTIKSSLRTFAECEAIHTLNITIKTLKDSFLKTGRLDSEYYQSKYENIESKIKNYHEGYIKLGVREIKDSNFTPKKEQKYRYIELANISSNGVINEPLEELGKDLPTRARRLVKEGDLIVSSIEGSLSSCALITKEYDSCIVSTGFYVLKAKEVNSETLLVLFKSQFFQNYLKKFPSGTILTAISKDELQNILIPKIDSKIQEEIAKNIQKSFMLRNEAKELLNTAKKEVQNAIANGGG